MSQLLRWGFLGAGKITHEFVCAVKTLSPTDHQCAAIACRNLVDAENFAQSHGLPKAYGSYKELIDDSEIDIVYVGTINSQHYGPSKLAIEAGKHVLCEKPLCLTGPEARDLVRLAREKNVFLMEGFWTRFFPAFRSFMEEIETGKVGDIKQVILTVGNVASHLDRFRLLELGGGSLMNHGCYGVAFATRILGKPDSIVASGHLSEGGVDLHTTVVMNYNDGRTAVTVCNSLVKMPGELFAIGTKGTVKIPWPYWAPTVLESTVTGRQEFALPDLKTSAQGCNTIGFTYEVEEVRRCIMNGLTESPEMPLDESILIYEVIDEMRRQLGVKYPQDS